MKRKTTELTVEKLLTYKGFENFTEEEALEAIRNIKCLSRIVFMIYEKDNKESERKEPVT